MDDKLSVSEPKRPEISLQKGGKILSRFDMSRSRRYSTRQSKATRSFLFYTIGIAAALLLFGFVGFQLLINYSLLLDKFRGESKSATKRQKDDVAFLSSPQFDIPYSATDSSSLSFEGKADKDTTVELFINDKLIDTTDVDESQYEFKKIKLSEGENKIKTRTVKDREKSSFSQTAIVRYRANEPKLEISNPNNGDSFSGGQSILKVSGKTEPYAKVTINGTWAIMDDEGNFQYNYQMQGGENTLNIVTKDDANNKVEKEVKFTYSP